MSVNVKAKIGTVAHRSDLNTPRVKAAIKYLSKETGKTEAEIVAHLTSKEAEFKDLEKKSPILYSAIAANIHEQELYKLFRELKVNKPSGCAEFDPITFMQLVRRVKVENPSMFPLRNFVDKKPLAAPRIIIVPTPDKKDEHFNKIETAAATPKGEFIFNKDCMQRDMNFAYVQGVKPAGKKYASNGGPFPDEWAPVEFTILHEFFHYTHGDFHYQQVMGGNPTIHNWAGDFRSNHDLIKAGHHPYAEGLFSDYVNYDTYGTYREMYKAVEDEFKKLSKDMQQKVEQVLGGKGDDHEPHQGEKQPQIPGQGKPTEEELEGHSKKTSEKAEKQEEEREDKGDEQGTAPKATKGGRGQGGESNQKIDWSGIRPRYTWKELLKRLVRGSETSEVTYQKVHRRNITSVRLATQTGAGVVRPGEKEVQSNLVKLCIVVDSSGSMADAITTVMANIHKLLTEGAGELAKTFVYAEFSSGFDVYTVTISGRSSTATKISSVKEIKQRQGGTIKLSDVMGTHRGGSTNFSTELVSMLDELAAQNYNIVVLTDSDIAGGGNKEEFLDLWQKHRSKVYLILDSKETFRSVAKTMGSASANISHL